MVPSDEVIPGTPEHWLARAAGHLALAQQPKPPGGFWEDLAFHAQQAAELAIKAVYQARGLKFRFTHDLEHLAEGLEHAGIELPAEVRDAVKLTVYAVEARYPGAMTPVTQDEYEEALRLAQAVVDWAGEMVREADPP